MLQYTSLKIEQAIDDDFGRLSTYSDNCVQ